MAFISIEFILLPYVGSVDGDENHFFDKADFKFKMAKKVQILDGKMAFLKNEMEYQHIHEDK